MMYVTMYYLANLGWFRQFTFTLLLLHCHQSPGTDIPGGQGDNLPTPHLTRLLIGIARAAYLI